MKSGRRFGKIASASVETSPQIHRADSTKAKLDAVRFALRAGDGAAASKHGRVFELTPVAAK
jgi:hypothetical protein